MNVRLQYTLPFVAGVHYDDQLIMNNYLLKVYMITNVHDADLTNTAFERLKYFVNEEMFSTVFVNGNSQDVCKRYIHAGIRITSLPNEPVDQIIGFMLFHKLNAIMEERISVLEIELSSSLGDHMVYLHNDQENTEDIEMPAWWTSPDLVHCDLSLLNNDSNTVPLHSAIWRDLNLAWPEEQVTQETGNIVFADFGRDETKP